jgi:hypothetical protein
VSQKGIVTAVVLHVDERPLTNAPDVSVTATVAAAAVPVLLSFLLLAIADLLCQQTCHKRDPRLHMWNVACTLMF